MSDLDPCRKIVSARGAAQWRQARRDRVVFTNGVFDLLHAGHIDVLRAARAAGDTLVVGVNSDDSVRRLKGRDRPVRPEQDRLYVLAALEMVDLVVPFTEDTPRELVRALLPDVIVKGGDYAADQIVGAADVLARGGSVVVVPLRTGHSTTAIIEKLRAHAPDEPR